MNYSEWLKTQTPERQAASLALSANATTEVMQARCQHDWRTDLRNINDPGKVWYFCAKCGLPESNLGAKRSAEIAKEKEMAKYDQGGGCPCGLYKECECDMAIMRGPAGPNGRSGDDLPVERTPTWGPKVGSGLSLGDKLKVTLVALEAANIKRLEEKANADIAKIERERADIAHFVEGIKNSMVQNIERGKVPLLKIKDYGRISWIQKAQKGNAPHQLYWNEMLAWFGKEKLRLEVIDEHDGVGMKSWLNVTVTPVDTVLTYRHGRNL